MDEFLIIFTRSARKELEALDAKLVNRIIKKIESLSIKPFQKDARKLKGEQNLWRIRVGDYRIIYVIDTEKRLIDIISIRHRREAYR